jgi:hypothetical protein
MLLRMLILTSGFTFTSVMPAMAFTLNKFIRVPDWMDFYLIMLAVCFGVSMVLVQLTKPAGVPFNQLYLHAKRLSTFTNLARWCILASLGLFILMFFIGMGLARIS